MQNVNVCIVCIRMREYAVQMLETLVVTMPSLGDVVPNKGSTSNLSIFIFWCVSVQ